MADDADFTPEELELLDEMLSNLKAIKRHLTNTLKREKTEEARFDFTATLDGKDNKLSNIASAGEKNSGAALRLVNLTPLQPIPDIESTMVMEHKEDQIEDLVDASVNLVLSKGAAQVTEAFNNSGLGAEIRDQLLQPLVPINQQIKCTSSTFVPGVFISNRLLDLYTKCGSLVDAQKVFDEMGNRDLCPHWVTMTGMDSIKQMLAQFDELQHILLTPVTPRLPPKPPDIILFYIRAIIYICDLYPQSVGFLVHHDVVPALCQRLLAIEYQDVAEQCLQALEKISREQPLACLQAGAMMIVLTYIDLFSTSIQRVTLYIVVNICKKLPSESPSQFMAAWSCSRKLLKDFLLKRVVSNPLPRPRCFSSPAPQSLPNTAHYSKKGRLFTGAALGLVIAGGTHASTVDEATFCGWLFSTTLVNFFSALLDPKFAHTLAVSAAARGWVPREKRLDPSIFDKNAQAVDGVLALGFGFVEVGSVTPVPQDGNLKPLIFSLRSEGAIINRCGFNSEGIVAVAVAKRLGAQHGKRKLDETSSTSTSSNKAVKQGGKAGPGILGVNLGKNKTSEDAVTDYVQGVHTLSQHADYLVINVSSPNTSDTKINVNVFPAGVRPEEDSPKSCDCHLVQPGSDWRDVLILSGQVGWLLSLYAALRQKISCEGYWRDYPIAFSARLVSVQFRSITGIVFLSNDGKRHEQQLPQLLSGIVELVDPPEALLNAIQCGKSDSEMLDGCHTLLAIATVTTTNVNMRSTHKKIDGAAQFGDVKDFNQDMKKLIGLHLDDALAYAENLHSASITSMDRLNLSEAKARYIIVMIPYQYKVEEWCCAKPFSAVLDVITFSFDNFTSLHLYFNDHDLEDKVNFNGGGNVTSLMVTWRKWFNQMPRGWRVEKRY